ncbi:uncharacterized protein MICPUCDRAFT_16153 [Micromonas pusilla CCMP1545]|uniref:Predicted protein n=1 Tax=Micromonas pusilla (strain CCMP1545) TaxID=564608 RepID=C1MRC1_MICPC|nr:uncharacterized protein MICPUCDRAFT_16153 [Micromonas pusilla CCMP1545]EEH57854.1 predicted protein [Micromonas pusilla CCMP1545]|eukprot:XP_003057903.1 predicted protein [Micromonas pusilla CCMP1545]
MSGVTPTDKCKEEFAKLKHKRAYKFITFKIDQDAGTVDVLDLHAKTFQMVLDKLPADEPRYLVMDWDVENDDGCQMSKIFFVSWVPDTCKAKTKMLYASSKQALRNALEGVHLDHQATDYDEITPAEFNDRSLGK